ncbi:MAG: hypothetical protein AB7K86_07585 [Rhodospirillales bacterium]
MSAWAALDAELDRWRSEGRAATLWWRDDDAAAATPALHRLLAVRRGAGVPLALAAIPAAAEDSLAAALAGEAGVTVLVHGFAHRNHAGPGARKAEFGAGRDPSEAAAEIAAGKTRLEALLPGRTAPVFAPPWNRIAAAIVARLPGLGFVGISAIGARAGREAAAGLVQVNVHADPVDWRGTRGFRGGGALVNDLAGHLAARRTGAADPDEPTGLMTHHAVHDGCTWRFLERLFERSLARGARWISAPAAFGLGS